MIITGKYPSLRLRRSRQHDWSRRLIQENNLSSSDLILPIFLTEGKNKKIPVQSMPGVYRYSINNLGIIVDKAIKKMIIKINVVSIFLDAGVFGSSQVQTKARTAMGSIIFFFKINVLNLPRETFRKTFRAADSSSAFSLPLGIRFRDGSHFHLKPWQMSHPHLAESRQPPGWSSRHMDLLRPDPPTGAVSSQRVSMKFRNLRETGGQRGQMASPPL